MSDALKGWLIVGALIAALLLGAWFYVRSLKRRAIEAEAKGARQDALEIEKGRTDREAIGKFDEWAK